MPFDAVNSAVVRIVSRVLSAQREDTSFGVWTACFQQRLSVRLAEIVMHVPSDKEQVCWRLSCMYLQTKSRCVGDCHACTFRQRAGILLHVYAMGMYTVLHAVFILR